MNYKKLITGGLLIIILSLIVQLIFKMQAKSHGLIIIYPFNNTLFPPEFPVPAFEWKTDMQYNGIWTVELITYNKKFIIKEKTDQLKWSPRQTAWDSLKLLSCNKNIKFIVYQEDKKRSGRNIRLKISNDTVGAPVLYRQMPIPFVFAEKNLDSMNYMLINFGSNNPPHIAMKGFPVCGNCHSITVDGNTIGLDLDAGRRDKGGYFVSEITDSILFNHDNYMSWSKIENRRTFGLFSKISPTGRFIVTTVKDRVLSKNFESPDQMAFSQLFFPVNGHLGVYDHQIKKIKELPGADLDEFVQSNAIWTPDGKYIIFSRAKALPYEFDSLEINVKSDMLIDQYIERRLQFKYDLCIIPFNEGNGGKAEPIEGASDNNMSNYFPAVSPDGKWLVFCQSENFMLLQPDSKLYIVPLKGGKARKLDCNLYRMNSWHAWSPNSKWIVFSSKGLSPYTDMFLSHIDEKGNASVPVLVERARANRRVINYPEFVNRKPENSFDMAYDYVELSHIERALIAKDYKKAKKLVDRFIEQNPILFQEDYIILSNLLKEMGEKDLAKKYDDLASGKSN
jgi:hypothetical protein